MAEAEKLASKIDSQETKLAATRARIAELKKIIVNAKAELDRLQPDAEQLGNTIEELRVKLKIASAEEVLSTQDFITFAKSIPGIDQIQTEKNRTFDHGPILSFAITGSATADERENIGSIMFFPSQRRITLALSRGDNFEKFDSLSQTVASKLDGAKLCETDDKKARNWENVDVSKLSQ